MSELIRVEREFIPKDWKVEEREHIRDEYDLAGEVINTYSVYELWVEFPESGWANSYHPEDLVIEASNVDHVLELRANNIPFQSTADCY